MESEKNSPSSRDALNRYIGLSSYAGGILLLGLLAFGLYEDGLKDLQSTGIIAAAAIIFIAIGYTTTGKKIS
ncbi:hypothetical protein [Lacipirellula parvula]|uniref:Uncharacterized protein n=1 Tax=Lacipirellula parvula TaxID=2650471 RepID=A0A5K7X2G3_9BACT|nr:hypothetical protein [Lacipirellula parvula]BBO30844.1 hypothetical protein PLANPX_0456 [Lacipirellula parvula]